MEKIKIKVPQTKDGKFYLAYRSGHLWRVTGISTLKSTQRLILKAVRRGKTAVSVNYGEGYCNETINSTDQAYLLSATACFLEDYLTPDMVKKYGRNNSNLD